MFPMKDRKFLTKREYKKVVFTVIISCLASIFVASIVGPEKRQLGFFICIVFAALIYFGLSNILFKD